MAPLRFSVPNAEEFDPRIWETAYITGIEGIPWQCEHSVAGNQFNIGRQIDESGKLNIVWPTRSYGNLCLNTTSLRISDSPYALPIELARGTVHRLKTQAAEWQRFGMRLPEKFFPLAELALEKFLTALTTPADQAQRICDAQQSIDLALQASVALCDSFSTQALEARRNNEGRLATLLGCQLDPDIEVDKLGMALRTAFNLTCISADLGIVESNTGGRRDFTAIDRQVDWACSESSKICLGPLVDFRDERLPQWLFLLNEGFESVMQLACDYAQKTVERYRGRVHLWNCAAGINVPNQFGWNDEQILRMSVSLIETVRRCDERTPVLLSIDQPWAEYLRKDTNGISPLHFADALIRADLGLSGLALELNFDQWPGGSFPRDPIELNQLVDRWSMLGLPLMVIVSAPTWDQTESANQDPPQSSALSSSSKRIAEWKTPDPSLVCGDQPKSSETRPHIPADIIIKLLLSKPSVHAVIWNTVNDCSHRNHNHSGLWNPNGEAKPILSELAKLRQSNLH